jgi:hypothetical protein
MKMKSYHELNQEKNQLLTIQSSQKVSYRELSKSNKLFKSTYRNLRICDLRLRFAFVHKGTLSPPNTPFNYYSKKRVVSNQKDGMVNFGLFFVFISLDTLVGVGNNAPQQNLE